MGPLLLISLELPSLHVLPETNLTVYNLGFHTLQQGYLVLSSTHGLTGPSQSRLLSPVCLLPSPSPQGC